jgi:two-component system chemotaxis response regulator CheB
LISREIRVLVVDDSVLAREIITRILESDPQIKVAGVAVNGKDAVELASKLKPDLITMDIKMPVMDGLEAIKKIMALNHTPIIVITGIDLKGGTKIVFEAVSAGALDVMQKPSAKTWLETPETGKVFIDKVKILSEVKTITHLAGRSYAEKELARVFVPVTEKIQRPVFSLIAIAASTGGPNAVLHVLKEFPPDLPAGIIVVQHIADGFVPGFVDWLNSNCAIAVREAKEGDELTSGLALVAPVCSNIKITKDFRVTLDSSKGVSAIMPSADILFSSVAEIFKSNAIGIVLTGMGSDGSTGMKLIKHFGGKTIAQDEESCVVFGMPKEAIKNGSVDKVLSLDKIAFEAIKLLRKTVLV